MVLPPLPHGQSTLLYRFEDSYVEARRVSLEVFLRRCASHPLVRESRSLAAFLAAGGCTSPIQLTTHSLVSTLEPIKCENR